MKRPGHDLAAERPRALLLAPEPPYPAAGGGPLRTACIFEYLARRFALDVIVFRQPGQPAAEFPPGQVKRLLCLELPRHGQSSLARWTRNGRRLLRGVPPLVDRFAGFDGEIARFVAAQRYEWSVIEHFWCAPYWKVLSPVSGATVLDLHNIESVLHERCAASEPFPSAAAHRAFVSRCRRLEREWLPRFDVLLPASECDAGALAALAPGSRIVVFPNALRRMPQSSPAERREEIVFSGNLEYHPNTSAARWFHRDIWPLIRAAHPHLTWRLVGKNPQAVAGSIRGPGIEFSGPIDDAIGEIARAQVAVVPLLSGSGTRFKILEAWAAGTPVVSTTVGAEGLPVKDGEHLLIADDSRGFAASVLRLLESEELRARLSAAGCELLNRDFTWDAAWSRLDSLGGSAC